MRGEFDEIVSKFPGWLDTLKKSPALARNQLQNIPDQGIYVFFDEHDQPLYVGRSDKMRSRLLMHSRRSAGHFVRHVCVYAGEGGHGEPGGSAPFPEGPAGGQGVFPEIFSRRRRRFRR